MDTVTIPDSEIHYRTSRSGGKGGQNVNKVETKVELLWDIMASQVINEWQRELIVAKLAKRITEGLLVIVSQSERTQMGNKKKAREKLQAIVNRALQPRAPRIATGVSEAQKAKRRQQKDHNSRIKAMRRADNEEEE